MATEQCRWVETRKGIEFQLALWAEDPKGWELVNSEARGWLLTSDALAPRDAQGEVIGAGW